MAVRFTPSARTAWHSHAVGQTLYVTEGRGLIQARGGEINEIRAGDIITTPGGGLRLAIRDATVRAYQQPRFAEGGIRHSLRMTDNIPVDRTEAADAARQPSRAPCSGGGPAATAILPPLRSR